jgi:hypothetical protein
MLIKAKALTGYKMNGLDGEIGKVKEFYFDDRFWTIRYLVAETGDWLIDRQVLLSPYSLVDVNQEKKIVSIELTKEQIVKSPPLNSDRPVSRQFEEAYFGYYGWPTYWSDSYMWGFHSNIVRDKKEWRNTCGHEKPWDAHLRSTLDVTGHHIQAADSEIGHVEDFIIDDDTWSIRYLLVDTNNWLPGKRVLIAPQWIESVSWSESKVYVNLLKETIKHSPEFRDESLLTRDYETDLHRYYNRREYWVSEPYSKTDFC